MAILGGGVAGLACALRLRSVVPSVSVTVIEADDRPGGKVRGDLVDGCVIDGGPDLCVEAKLLRTHMYEELAIQSELIPVNPAGLPTLQRCGGKLSAIPRIVTDGLVTMRGGMHDIVKLMVAAMPGVRMALGKPVTLVERLPSAWRIVTESGASMESHAIVCALPATSIGPLFQQAAPPLAKAASTVKYVPMTTVSAAWPASHVRHNLRGTGYIESEPKEGAMSACTWTSSKIPIRSPYDTVLVRGYVGTCNREAATIAAMADIRTTLGIAAEPLWTRAFAWCEALPRYPDHHATSVSSLRREVDYLRGFALAGAAWDGAGIGDCIGSGERAAERIAADVFGCSPAE